MLGVANTAVAWADEPPGDADQSDATGNTTSPVNDPVGKPVGKSVPEPATPTPDVDPVTASDPKPGVTEPVPLPRNRVRFPRSRSRCGSPVRTADCYAAG